MKKTLLVLMAVTLLYNAASYPAKVDTLNIFSAAMNKTLKTAVVLPDAYGSSQKTFPVVYLLHGGQGTFSDWLTKMPDKLLLHKLADQYGVIIVTPEGSINGYYFDSNLDKSNRFETFVTQEVLQKVDASYRTIKDRKGRIIAGLSMGGFGAMRLAALHPDLYCAAGSMSGVMNLNTATWHVPAEFAKLRDKNFVRLLGPPTDPAKPYVEFSIVGMTDRLKANDVKLIFDCGADDIMIEPNRELHRLLTENGTPHDYIERPGKHEWPYWGNALPYQFLFFQKVFLANGTLQ
jgi:S-formylglutathione hydrolase FrmB